jgi:type II secretion system protein G
MRMSFQKQKGFTIIELLVVIAIIGLLASVVVASMNSSRTKAQNARLKADMHMIEQQVAVSRTSTLAALTGSYCTSCIFNNTVTMKSQTANMATLTAAWKAIGYSTPPTDPWGNPYLMDENELEGGSCTGTDHDVIYSAGPDGIFATEVTPPSTPDMIAPDGAGDDYAFSLRFGTCGD